jgi:hypothetical protein
MSGLQPMREEGDQPSSSLTSRTSMAAGPRRSPTSLKQAGRRRTSLRRRTRDAERQLDGVRHLIFHLSRHDAEVAALGAEVGADDQQVTFLVWDALAELVAFPITMAEWGLLAVQKPL